MSRAVRYLIIRSNNSKKYGESIQVYGGFKNKEKAEKCAELLNAQQNANSAIELQLHLLGYYDDLDIDDGSTNYYVEECDIYDEKAGKCTTSYTDIQKFWEDVAKED